MRVWKGVSANTQRRLAHHERYWNQHKREYDNGLA
jgi:hypothetical protein